MHPYELLKLRKCMQNSARMQQLGIPVLVCLIGNKRVLPQHDATPDHRNDRDCDPNYIPELDDTNDRDLCATRNAKVPIPPIL